MQLSQVLMDQHPPKLSIITVCFNAATLIKKSLASAVNQTFQDFELVIVDGGSSDNTLEELEGFKYKIGTLVSEKDAGIYDAMNKGISLAKGEWIYFLNAGDAFFNEHVLEKVFNEINQVKPSFLYAKVQTVNEPTGVNYIAGQKVSLEDFWFKYPICHQATFAKKELFLTVGMFNTHYQLISDTEWFIRVFKHTQGQTHYIDELIAFYDVTGATYQKRMLGMKEYIHAGFRYFPIPVALLNLFSYPVIWLKVKIIRMFQHTVWFKAYRNWKFKQNKA